MEREVKVSSSWSIPNDMHGLRADQYLARRIGRISRQRAKRIIAAQDFLLDGMVVKASSRVRNGQRATLKRFAPDSRSDIKNVDVRVVFEDDHVLVVNKPAGLTIHPSANSLYKTLTYFLRTRYLEQKINPCHRLDKETSGIVVCAKTRWAEREIKIAFMNSQVSKTYLAVVDGHLKQKHLIDIPLDLQKDRGLVAIRMIEDHEGKPAKTVVRPLVYDARTDRTLVLCKPKTGRQHQIRAHLSIIGFPIVGDKLYNEGDQFFDRLSRGDDHVLRSLAHTRHALHASRIQFWLGSKRYVFSCSIPDDFYHLIAIP